MDAINSILIKMSFNFRTLFKQKTNRNTSMLYFGKKYSKRHFQFNTNELRYSKAHCDELTHSIPLSSIKSVRLLNLNLKKSNVIEVSLLGNKL